MKFRLLLLTILLTMSVIPGYCYDMVYGGIYYNVVSTHGNGRVSLQVTYRDEGYNSYSGAVSIPSTFKIGDVIYEPNYIGPHAFFNCENLTAIYLGTYMYTIQRSAFAGCKKLKTVVLGSYTHYIEPFAFHGCESLEHISFNSDMRSIGTYAFSNCYSLSSISFGSGVSSFGEGAFAACSSLMSVSFGNSMGYTSGFMFEDCCRLRTVYLSNGFYYIGNASFNNTQVTMSTVYPSGGAFPNMHKNAFWGTGSDAFDVGSAF